MSPKSPTSSSTRAASLRKAALLLAGLVAAGPALAHPGHGAGGFLAGATHPLLGPDHLLAMIASGLWAATIGGRARAIGPLGFLGGMVAGAVIGMAGLALPAVEAMVAGSVLLLGVLVTLRERTRLAVALPVFALVGFAHGNAHGLEAHDTGHLLFIVGMVATTALLHAAGLAIGAAAHRHPHLARTGGVGVAAAGMAMLAG